MNRSVAYAGRKTGREREKSECDDHHGSGRPHFLMQVEKGEIWRQKRERERDWSEAGQQPAVVEKLTHTCPSRCWSSCWCWFCYTFCIIHTLRYAFKAKCMSRNQIIISIIIITTIIHITVNMLLLLLSCYVILSALFFLFHLYSFPTPTSSSSVCLHHSDYFILFFPTWCSLF